MIRVSLRTKFLLSLALISALLTWATLLLVRQRVQVQVRQEIVQGLHNSVVTFQSFQQQRESTLERSAALLATLPPLKAVMTSRDMATIQDASATFWKLSGSQLFALADRDGRLMAIHTSVPDFAKAEAQESILRSLGTGNTRDWWYGNGHLFQVFLQPIYFGSPEDNTSLGLLAVGYDIDVGVAQDASRVASSQVAFRSNDRLVASTVAAGQQADLARHFAKFGNANGSPEEIELAAEKFLVSSVRLSAANSAVVTLTVLKSFDEATRFLQSLNQWIVGLGIAAVFAGSLLIFFVSTTITRPLDQLVDGVRALEKGNFDYPLRPAGSDEIAALTAAFLRMRTNLQEAQQKLIEAERLATIGRMASMISHDLRHPLTAILAYAEFLSERDLSDIQRNDCFQEIRIAVNKMTDEISSLLGFSKQREAIHPVHASAEDVIEHAIQTVKVLPEFSSVEITFTCDKPCDGWFDPPKLERALLNLLFNAAEAVPPDSGKIAVVCRKSEQGLEIRVTDNGPGIPEQIRQSLFQPFVSFGKEKGIGLGLTAVHKIMQSHGGEVSVENSGPGGSVFRLRFPEPVATGVG